MYYINQLKYTNMKVILKKDLAATKFNTVFKKGIPLNYNEDLKAVEHPTMSNIWRVVKPNQFEIAKNYVIMGDNNFWYCYISEVTKKGLKEAIKEIKDEIKINLYETDSKPYELHVFETIMRDTIKIK